MIILDKTSTIKKHNCEVQVTEVDDNHISNCQVICSGKSKKNQWQVVLPSIYGGYAMLLDKHLIDLPSKLFLVRQINEHSRGGHIEYEIHLMDLYGKVINKFTGSYNSKFILDDKFLWFYVSGKKPYSYTFNYDLKIIKLDYTKGVVEKVENGKLPTIIYKQFWN
jgi:hypothetical protein